MNELFSNFILTLSSPMVLCFALGVFASLIKSDLKLPEALYSGLTIYLLLAIGFKGGVKIADTSFSEFAGPGVLAVFLGVVIPLWCYFILRKLGRFNISNSAAIAAHYGSVSVVTFGAGLAFLDNLKISYESYLPALLAIMEIPAILVAIFVAKVAMRKKESEGDKTSWSELFHDLFAGKSTVLLMGGLLVGYISGHDGYLQVAPFFDAPFRGILTIFLLEIGLVAGRHIKDISKAGPFLVAFGILMPIINGCVGAWMGSLIGLSVGGSTMLAILSASASYIAAPAAVRVALPQANPAYYITASLAITFPFNVTLGIPLYHSFALYLGN